MNKNQFDLRQAGQFPEIEISTPENAGQGSGFGLGEAARQMEAQLAHFRAESTRLKDSHSRLLQELEEARNREIASSTQIRALTDHLNRAKQDLIRYHDAWSQVNEKEKMIKILVAEHEEKKGLATEVGNELAMLRGQMTCEKTAREEFERRNRALELELTRLQSMTAVHEERAQSQSAQLEQTRQEVRYFQGLVDRHQGEISRIREQVSEEVRSETEARYQSELQAQKQTFDRMLGDLEKRSQNDLEQRQSLLQNAILETERRYQAEIEAIKKSHALVLAHKESRHAEEIDQIQTMTSSAIDRIEARHEKDWALIKVRFDQFVDGERATIARESQETLVELEARYSEKIRELTDELSAARALANSRESEMMKTAQSEIAALKKSLADANARSAAKGESEIAAKAAIDQLSQAQAARIDTQKKQFALLKEILFQEKSKVRAVAEQMNDLSRDDLRQKLLSLAEI